MVKKNLTVLYLSLCYNKVSYKGTANKGKQNQKSLWLISVSLSNVCFVYMICLFFDVLIFE